MTPITPPKRWAQALAWHDALLLAVFALAVVVGAKAWSLRSVSPPEVAPLQPPITGSVKLLVRVNAATPLEGAEVRVFEEAKDGRYPQVAFTKTAKGGQAIVELRSGATVWVVCEAPGLQRRSRRLRVPAAEPLSFVLKPASKLKVSVVDDQHEPIANATLLVRETDLLPFGGLTDASGEHTFFRLGASPYQVEVFARGYESALRAEVNKDLEVVLRRLGSIAVSVLGPDGKPAPEAQVSIVGSSLWPTRKTQTGKDGTVKLNGLFPGLYDLQAAQGELVSEVLSAVNLARGEHKSVELKLRRGRSVLGRVVGGVQEPKFPVKHARVVLTELGISSFPISAETNERGETRIGPVTDGPAYLSARAEGFVGRGAVPVPAELDGPIEIALARGGTLRGLVVDKDDRPIEGARVEIVGIDQDGLPIAETPLLSAMREAHFQWSLQPLPLMPAGELGVTLGPVPLVHSLIHGSSSVPTETDWTTLPDDYKPWISGYNGEFKAFPVTPGRLRALVRHPAYVEALSESVVIGPGGTATVKVVMRQGAELLGRVLNESGRPVAGVRVRVTAQKGSFERSVISQSDGMFRLSAVPAEVSVALARPDDLTRFVVRETLTLKDAEEKELEFVLPDGRESLRWRVVDGDDRPIDLGQVTFLSVDPKVPLRATRFSNAKGFVELEDAVGLALRVSARAPGYVQYRAQLKSAPQEQDLVLQVGVWLQGKVTAVRGRTEVGGARVSLSLNGFQDSVYTDARGLFEFRQVPLGDGKVAVAHDNYARREVSVRVTKTGHVERAFEVETIDLPEASSVAGFVLSSEGEGIPGARVGLSFLPALVPRGRLLDDTAVTGADGAFVLRGLSPGEHTLHAYSSIGMRGKVSIEISAGDALTDIRLALTEDGEGAELDVGSGGVAVTLGEKITASGSRVVIVQVAPRSEAARVGLLRGDLVAELDGSVPGGMRDARERLNGKPGTDLVVSVQRDGQPLSFRVRREQLTH